MMSVSDASRTRARSASDGIKVAEGVHERGLEPGGVRYEVGSATLAQHGPLRSPEAAQAEGQHEHEYEGHRCCAGGRDGHDRGS